MADSASLTPAMHAYYELGKEADRLGERGPGRLEFDRTREIVLRALPPAPAVVADIGGGPGRYAFWLAELGYRVVHRDLVPLHVEHVTSAATAGSASVESAVGDARDLDLADASADASADAVLLLGPLYHLDRADRIQALREAGRIVRPGGSVFGAAISRWAPRLDGVLAQRLYETEPDMEEMVAEVERTGVLQPLFPGSFCGFTHRPDELRAEAQEAGLELTDLVCVEGAAIMLADLTERAADPEAWRIVLDSARGLERVPELLGIGPHLIVTARRPAG
jgi:SAM-dependent methyltransferase